MSGDRTAARVATGVLVVAPLLVVASTAVRRDAGLVLVGLLPALFALRAGRRTALRATGLTAVVAVVGLLVSGSAVLSALLVAAMGPVVAWAWSRGLQQAGIYVAVQACVATVAAPRLGLVGADAPRPDSVTNALLVGLVVLVSGGWVSLVGSRRSDRDELAEEPHADPVGGTVRLRYFAAGLSVLLGVGTLVLQLVRAGGNSWWLLLTVLLVATPDDRESRTRAAHRAAGTVVGGTVAGLLTLAGPPTWVLVGLGVAAGVASVVLLARGPRAPYWAFVLTMTVALVLLTFPEDATVRTDVARIGYTCVAAVLVAVASAALPALHRVRRR